ncbi:MAG TPA: SpoIIE family protein phosphatase [Trebonia sp.]
MAEAGNLPADFRTSCGIGRARGPCETAIREHAIGGLAKDHGAARAAREHTLIDQATGWLAGRLDCGIGEATGHLASLARDTGTSIAEAAALLLGDGTAPAVPRQAEGSATSLAQHLLVPPQSRPPQPQPAQELPLSVVDVIPGPALMLAPVTSEDGGEVTDFTIERSAGLPETLGHPSGGGLIAGARLSAVFPPIRQSGLLATLVQAFESGQPLALDLFPVERIIRGNRETWRADIRARRVGRWLLVTWNGHEPGDLARRVEGAARPGWLGWAEWNLITGTATWSRSLDTMHGRPPGTPPPAPEEYPRLVHPDDAAAVEDAIRAPADRGESAQAEYRVETAEGTRHLKALVTAVYDPLGAPLILRAVVQDATAGRTAELELAAARAKIEVERREATLRMQQAILPSPEHQFRWGRFDIAVRYQPAQSGNRVGGDWYEARAADDGAVMVTIGDVAGHGLTAAAGMARIGNALRGMTVTRQLPDTLLRWLNDLICTDEIPERVASVAVGLLDADPPRMRWAQAGHPPPVLVRGGEPRLLARPAGLLLGTMPGAGYELVTQDLAPGDRLIFYTDGLIERRGHDIDDGLTELLKAAASCQDATAAACAAELADRLSPGGDDDICVLVVHVR